MELNSEKITNVLNGMLGHIEQEQIDLYKGLIEKRGNIKIDDYNSFYLSLIYPYKQFLTGLIHVEVSKNKKISFFLINSNFIERQFAKLIEDFEGSACSADKSRTIMRRIFNFLMTGNKIEWDYNAEYTFHLPKKIFKTHESIIEFYNAVTELYYGNYKKYVAALQNVLIEGKTEKSNE